MPKTPEQWLEQAAPEKKAGIFKLFLGYAPGVGKTYNMLSEALRRHKRGEDVVIGLVETHGRKGIAELAARLEELDREQWIVVYCHIGDRSVDACLALWDAGFRKVHSLTGGIDLWSEVIDPEIPKY